MWQIDIQSRDIRTHVNAEAQLQRAKSAGANSVCIGTVFGGALYNSAYYSRGPGIETGFDPLAFMISRGHELGMKIYVWLCPGVEVYSFDSTWDLAGKYNSPTDMHWLNFSIPAARQRVADIVTDIYSKYTPDGITLDYIRYPNKYPITTWNPATYFQTSDITTTVDLVNKAISRRGKLQAYAFYADYLKVLQDWPNWIRNGLVDLIMPMMDAYIDTHFGYDGHILAYWIGKYIVPLNLPFHSVIPCLYVQDFYNDSSGNTMKPVSQVQTEIADAKSAGYTSLNWFDNVHLTQPYIDLLKKESIMPLVTDLTTVTNDIETQANSLSALATTLATLAAQAVTVQAQATDLLAQVAVLRQTITNLGIANGLADQLADLL